MYSKLFQTSTSTILVVLFFSIGVTVMAQQATPFKVRYQGHVNGDMTIIANTIVNRTDDSNSTASPYNETTNLGKLNDEFKMNYIDTDNDASTFSSSSANLVVENPSSKKIVYAGLYWAATYVCNSSKLVKKEKFKAIDANREAFDKVKIKLPNQEQYKTIAGELIFDGINMPDFKESAPYVLYADITNLVLNNENPFGTYTVADIKATVGQISGGVAAGWTIFFVYEDATMKDKFITSYDGFAGITDKSVDIPITGFQAVSEGKVTAKIASSALEGDTRLKGDQLLFKASETDKYTQVSNTLRSITNVFNSSITLEDTYFTNRVPNSLNTLGYDAFIMTINNPDNSVIGNNTHDATIRLKTSGDRFFMFFNAFEVEVEKPNETFADEVKEDVQTGSDIVKKPRMVGKQDRVQQATNEINTEEKTNKTASTKPNQPAQESSKPIATKEKAVVVKKEIQKTVVDTKPAAQEKKIIEEGKAISQRKKAILSPSISVPNKPKGYYIIANVFSKPSNANRFVALLRKRGMEANYFINPLNHYRYVYVSKHDTFEEASSLYDSNLNNTYFDDLWIMTINE